MNATPAAGTPLVSVVIPAYNAGDTLAQTLDSVLEQTYPHVEIVTIDDGSTDATARVLERYAGRVRSMRQANGGLAKARNAGCRLATGELIALLDADDLCMPERVALQVRALQSHPDAVLCSSDFASFDRNGIVSGSHEATYYSSVREAPAGLDSLYPVRGRFEAGGEAVEVHFGSVYRELVFGNFVHPPTVMFRREALARAGGFDETLRYNSDWEWFVRVARLGPFVHVDRPLLNYRLSERQLSSLRVNGGEGAFEAVRAAAKMWEADAELVHAGGERLRRQRRDFYRDAAYALSERRKLAAARMLAASVWHGLRDRSALRIAARILAPTALLRATAARRERRG